MHKTCRKEGVYEIIAGHRRKYAAQHLGFRKMPVIIRVLRDDDAVINMVDSNLLRESIRPSEKAFAYKMKYEAIKQKKASTVWMEKIFLLYFLQRENSAQRSAC